MAMILGRSIFGSPWGSIAAAAIVMLIAGVALDRAKDLHFLPRAAGGIEKKTEASAPSLLPDNGFVPHTAFQFEQRFFDTLSEKVAIVRGQRVSEIGEHPPILVARQDVCWMGDLMYGSSVEAGALQVRYQHSNGDIIRRCLTSVCRGEDDTQISTVEKDSLYARYTEVGTYLSFTRQTSDLDCSLRGVRAALRLAPSSLEKYQCEEAQTRCGDGKYSHQPLSERVLRVGEPVKFADPKMVLWALFFVTGLGVSLPLIVVLTGKRWVSKLRDSPS